MNEIVPFVFNHDQHDSPIRVLMLGGEPWFVAADVCRVLGLDNTTMALKRLDQDEKGLNSIETPGGSQEVNIISEPGLYSLIAISRKPQAKAFNRFVRHEVLPTLRRTGRYELPSAASDQPELLSAINEVRSDVADIKDQQSGMADQIGQILEKMGTWRKGFSKAAVRYACGGVANHNSCECVYCNEAVVVTKYGEPLANARVHHGNGNRADFRKENCVIPCAECHDRLTYANRPDHIPAYKALSIAETFHMKLSQKAARIYAPTMPAIKHWDMQAATQADMGFPVRRKHPA